jgi:single-stranded DNA-binding protein
MREHIKITGYIGKVTVGQYDDQPFIRFAVGAKSDVAVKTHWYSVTLWGLRKVNAYSAKIRKGDLVVVSGVPEIKTYIKDGEKRVSVVIRMGVNDRFRVVRRAANGAELDNEGGDDV